MLGLDVMRITQQRMQPNRIFLWRLSLSLPNLPAVPLALPLHFSLAPLGLRTFLVLDKVCNDATNLQVHKLPRFQSCREHLPCCGRRLAIAQLVAEPPLTNRVKDACKSPVQRERSLVIPAPYMTNPWHPPLSVAWRFADLV